MVYASAVRENASMNVLFAALLHDIGKPKARKVVHDTKRVRFFGHEGYSFYIAKDVLDHPCYSHMLDDESKSEILKLIALHSELFDWKKEGSDVFDRFNNDQKFLNVLAQVVENDYVGRLTTNPDHPCESWIGLVRGTKDEVKPSCPKDRPKLTLLIGPPGCGKSTYCDPLGEDVTIISRDNLVMEFGEKETYNDCWNSVDQKLIDKQLMSRFQLAVRGKLDVVVDMTNMSRKSRRKFLKDSLVKKNNYWKAAVVFSVGYDVLMERNKDRIGKNINRSIINSMCSRLCYPMYNEFDSIEMVGE